MQSTVAPQAIVFPVAPEKSVLGLDIGGANLKMAHSSGAARTIPFELWKNPDGLASQLENVVQEAPAHDRVVVTMTGELCDCFETRSAGVHTILDAVESVFSPTPLRIWRNDGFFVDVATARKSPYQVASANWLALATWAGRFAPRGRGLLIDIGSTTTDLAPLLDGRPVPKGITDAERLREEELIYRGIRRTPISWRLRPGLAAEVFATMLDAMILLDKVPENVSDCGTADGRPATKRFAHARMARMLGEDEITCPAEATRELAKAALADLTAEITGAVQLQCARLGGLPDTVVLAGAGEFLAWEIAKTHCCMVSDRFVSLYQRLGAPLSSAACAYAVAVLAGERDDGA